MGFFNRKKNIERMETEYIDDQSNIEVTPEKDLLKYKQRLMAGESELSAKSGLSYFKTTGQEKNIRVTRYFCPECKDNLQNIKLDGVIYFCPTCNTNYQKKSKIKRFKGRVTFFEKDDMF